MKLDISKAMQDVEVTVELTGMNKYRFRLWLAMRFIRLGIWIMGANFKGEVVTHESN
jgi:hypothetical protein